MTELQVEIEWPPESGRVAMYTSAELRLMRLLVERLVSAQHHSPECKKSDRASSRAVGRPDSLDCEFCLSLDRINAVHEFKVLFAEPNLGLTLTVALQAGGPSGDAGPKWRKPLTASP